jgi:deoxyadenosine/deoxycytidine kinase
MSLDIDMILQTEKLQKVHQILSDTNRKFIIVDGVIGAGKTTTIKEIEKRLNQINIDINNNINNNIRNNKYKICAIYEPVEIWKSTGALEYFYKDIPRNAYAFQTLTYITRIQSVIDEIYNNPDADIYILERSIWTDRYIFMELLKDLVSELEMKMYNQWCDMWAYILPMRVDKWVLLDTSLDESLKRISMRNREGETNGISVDYQTNLYKKHIEFYKKLANDDKPVIIIDSKIMDENFIDNSEKVDAIIEQIFDIKIVDLFAKPSLFNWFRQMF